MTISYFAAPGTRGEGFGIFTDKKIMQIEELVCQATGETPKTVKSRSRARNKVLSRQMIFYFLKKYTKLTLMEIGHMYGLQDHSTVLYGMATLKNLMFSEPHLKTQVDYIDNILKEDLRNMN